MSLLSLRCRKFSFGESGSLTIFGLFIFLMILMITGMAVDLMRTEHRRVAVQQTADTAVLASSRVDIDGGSAETEALVRSYFEKANLLDALPEGSITVQGATLENSKTVTVAPNQDLNTLFMRMVGVSELPVFANAQATQSALDVEISVVLDISSSMNRSERLPRLKDAVEAFALEVMPDGPSTSPSDISLNIVPYSLTTNPGDLAKYLNIRGKHSYSNCVWFENSDYTTLGLDVDADIEDADLPRAYERYSHMADGSSRYRDGVVNLPMCPDHAIVPMLTNSQDVIDEVDALSGWDGTGIDIGAKWGLALLDPSMRPAINDMIGDGLVGSGMVGRPYDYGQSRKFLIVMSDGENDSQRDLHDYMREGPSPIWQDTETGDFSVLVVDGRDDDAFDETNDTLSRWHHRRTGAIEAYPDTAGASDATDWTLVEDQMHGLDWPEVFNITKTTDLHDEFFEDIEAYFSDDQIDDFEQPLDFNRITEAQTNQRLEDVCVLARNSGVTVFAISFDPPSDLAQKTLRDCVEGGDAPQTGFFYAVDGVDISTAFKSIAGEISKLRLTQ